MKDLQSKHWIYAKGVLFVLTGAMASALLLWNHPDLETAALLAIAIWSFCRAYYFAFYVITHYVDPSFRFSGLGAFLLYCWKQK